MIGMNIEAITPSVRINRFHERKNIEAGPRLNSPKLNSGPYFILRAA
jgi:hypothetical protein